MKATKILLDSYNIEYLLNYDNFKKEVEKHKEKGNAIDLLVLYKNISTFKGYEEHFSECLESITIDKKYIDMIDSFNLLRELCYYNDSDELYAVFYGGDNAE